MNPQQEELFDEAILRVLDRTNSRFGTAPAAIMVGVIAFGFNEPVDNVERRLAYLSDPAIGRAAEVNKTANRANHTWKITAAGIDYLRDRGL
jgi:hypothetical protein